jgi:hypothetical protein
MQTHGGQAAHEAILALERTFVVDLKIDWHGDGQYTHDLSDVSPMVGSVTVNRALSGSLPQELMLVEGSSAAELTFTLGGEIPPGTWSTGSTDKYLSWASILSPYNGLSPLYNALTIGAEVKYRIGVETAVGTFWYPQFVGNIRTIQVSRSSHEVTITALDRSEKMRQPVDLPLWAYSSWHADRGYREAQLAWSHWVIDQCLRSADASTTPYRPVSEREGKSEWPNDNEWGLQFFMTGNGSHIPSVGVMGDARVLGFPWSEGTGKDMFSRTGNPHPLVASEVSASGDKPYNLNDLRTDTTGAVPRLLSQSPATTDTEAARSYNLQYRCRDVNEMKANADGTHFLGFTLLTPTGDDAWKTANVYPLEVYVGGNRTIRIHINAHSVRGEIWNWTTNTQLWGGSWVAIPSGQQSVEIGVQVYGPFDNTMRIATRAGSNFSGWADTADATLSPLPEDNREGVVRVRHQVHMQDIFWAVRWIFADGFNEAIFQRYARRPATYAAVLDPGLNKLTSTPTTTYEDGWALATSVAAAEMGAVFWDESGIFRFWNRDRIIALQSSIARTLTLDDVGDLNITDSSDSIRNIVSLETLVASADQDNVFKSSDPDQFYLAPGTAVATTIEISDHSIQSVTSGKVRRFATVPDANVPPPAWSDSTYHGYVVEFTATPENANSWAEKNNYISGVDVFAYVDSNGNLTITFYNGYSEHARFSKLHIGGTKITRQDTRIVRWEDTNSINKYGPRNLQLSGDWIQYQPESVQRLGQYLINRTVKSIPATDAINIAGDPRLQLGDTLMVLDPDGMGEELKLQVLGISRSFTKESGLVDTLTVELIRPPGVGIWDSAQYGKWNETFIWS